MDKKEHYNLALHKAYNIPLYEWKRLEQLYRDRHGFKTVLASYHDIALEIMDEEKNTK